MISLQLATARELAEQWPLLSDISLVTMIASTLNIPLEQALALWAKIAD